MRSNLLFSFFRAKNENQLKYNRTKCVRIELVFCLCMEVSTDFLDCFDYVHWLNDLNSVANSQADCEHLKMRIFSLNFIYFENGFLWWRRR